MLIEHAVKIDADTVEVAAKGPRGGTQEFTVHFDRHGGIKYGFGHRGVNGWMGWHLIPSDVREAAKKEMGYAG